jgi:hypothetical protein
MSITLTREELQDLTAYEQPLKQLSFLQERGFWRARLRRDGSVYLERAHYEAVCAGAMQAAKEPQLTL